MEFRSYQASVRTADRGPAAATVLSLQPAQANGSNKSQEFQPGSAVRLLLPRLLALNLVTSYKTDF